jgi:hypothetical protein
MVVEISNDGGQSWMNLETVGPGGDEVSGGWFERSFRIADALTPTSTMQIRFTAEDIGNPSIVEGAVDAVRVTIFYCDDSACLCETDDQPGIDVFDLLAYLDDWFEGAASADIDGAAGVNVFDLLAFLDCWFEGC